MSFQFRQLAIAVAILSTASFAQAAGLDRSTQPSWGFTQDGTFAYIEHVTIDPSIEGKDSSGHKVGDVAEDYHFLNFGAKADINDSISVGAFFDQPWGADVQYSGNNNFVGAPTNFINGVYAQTAKTLQSQGLNLPISNATDLQNAITTINNQVNAGQAQLTAAQTGLNQLLRIPNPSAAQQAQIAALQQGITAGTAQLTAGKKALGSLQQVQKTTNNLANLRDGTNVSVSSKNITGLIGFKFGQNKNFQVYGGPALQKLEADIHLRGDAYSTATGSAAGYDLSVPSNTAVGWMAGIAYSKPEIALKAALTYRSEIDHDLHVSEDFPVLALRGINPSQAHRTTVTTPESVNLDFQTGLNKTTLLTAKLRWVPWSKFSVTPKLYNSATQYNLVDYKDDSWTADIGLGKKLSDKWAVTGSLGWDSGAGDPTTTLGPVDGNWNIGLGARYNITPEWAVSAGAKYLKFGDATAQLPNHINNVGKFENNDGMVYGLRLSYQKK